MELLETGCQYDLQASPTSSGSESVLHVKLTDAALKAIEEYYEWTRKLKTGRDAKRSTIQFNGNSGVIQIPIRQSTDMKKFAFSVSASEQKDGSHECIRQSAKLSGSVTSVGIMSHMLRVKATDDVYQTTKEKMTLADEEVKKVRAKEINHSGPHISKKVVKKSTSAVGQSKVIPSPSLAAVAGRSVGRPKKIQPQTPSPDVVIPAKKKSDIPNSDRISSTPAPDKFSLRERVVHLLAVRAYKKPELILRLQRDGVKPDKNSLGGVLDDVAQQTRDSFTLHRHLYAEVRRDWPLYGDDDRRVLERKLSPVTELPALSPCVSVAGRESPAVVSSQKRSSSSARSISSPPPASKRRRTNSKSFTPVCNGTTATSGVSSASTAAVVNTRRRQSSSVSSNTTLDVDGLREKLKEDPELDDFTAVYPPLTCDSDRHRYKDDFTNEYSEYMRLHDMISQRMKTFGTLSDRLRQAPDHSAEYEKVKLQIHAEYKKLKMDANYADDRLVCAYLHRKLSHIKNVVHEYDLSRLGH